VISCATQIEVDASDFVEVTVPETDAGRINEVKTFRRDAIVPDRTECDICGKKS